MKVALIGVGQAGGKIAQALAEFDYNREFGAVMGAFAVNTARADLQNLDIDTMLIGQDRVKGHGVGGDNELGAEIMQEEATEVMDELDGRVTSKAEAIIVVAGLGGGTPARSRHPHLRARCPPRARRGCHLPSKRRSLA